MYYRICYLPVDGAAVPVGLRYDDGRERIIPHLLWALLDARGQERSVTALARYEYHTDATVACPGPRWRVVPPGDRFLCVVKTADGRQHAAEVAIGKGVFGPYPAVDAIAGLQLDPNVAALDARIASQLRDGGTISGPLVIELYDATTLRFFVATAPRVHAGKLYCPRILSPGSLNAFCTMESAFGYLRLGVSADRNDRIHFYPLSVPANMRAAERTGKKLIEAAYRRKGTSVVARIDCGQDKWITLPLPSVRYCMVALSNGRHLRMGVEYYDEIEGIHLSFEPLPSRGSPQ